MYLILFFLLVLTCFILMTMNYKTESMPIIKWRRATLTWYESFPTSEEECEGYQGCKWEGYFAAYPTKRTKQWVAWRNIVAVHSKHYNAYKNKWVRIRYGNKFIDCKVVDMCKDSDTESGKQCSVNRDYDTNNFLLDIESYTAKRIGFRGMDTCHYTIIHPSRVQYLYGTRGPWEFDREAF